MRVPLPVASFVAIAVTLGLWWGFTRQIDLLTPPSAESLDVTHQRAMASIPRARVPLPSQPPPRHQADHSPPRKIQTRAPESADQAATRNPSLDTYTNLAAKGSRHLIELSTLMEASGDRQRALLAWERVLDSTHPQASHLTAALAAVKRLRPLVPAWTAKNPSFPVVLHVSTSSKYEDQLKPILSQLAADLEQASTGILKVSTTLSATRKGTAKASATPLALWITGPGENPVSSATFSFTVTKPENLRLDLLRYLLKLVRNRLADKDLLTPSATPPKTEAPLDALAFRITRLRWHEFGQSLNPPAPPPP